MMRRRENVLYPVRYAILIRYLITCSDSKERCAGLEPRAVDASTPRPGKEQDMLDIRYVRENQEAVAQAMANRTSRGR
ncbi:MAG: hypothetical protein ACLTQI_08835 [Slackia sp.]